MNKILVLIVAFALSSKIIEAVEVKCHVKNEIFVQNVPFCESTCEMYGSDYVCPTTSAKVSGCRCRSGYVRHRQSGECWHHKYCWFQWLKSKIFG